MNIYGFAMQMEQDGAQFYHELASKTSNAGVKRILTMLADDEVKHYDIIQQLAAQADPKAAETTILSDAKNVFAEMQGTEFDLTGVQVDLYRKAQDIERQSYEFYTEKAEAVTDPSHKTILIKIADEEKRHYFLLDNIIEFVDRPHTWIENAEFNHLEEY